MGDVSLPDLTAGVRSALSAELGEGHVGLPVAGPPPVYPYAGVAVPQLTSEEGPTMGRYRRTAVYQIRAWGQSPDVDPESLASAAEVLADRIHNTLERARLNAASTLYAIPSFVLRTTLLVGGEGHLPATVQVGASLTMSWERRTGLTGPSAP